MARFKPSDDYYRLERLSWSGYRSYNSCPLAYKNRYVDRKKVEYNAYNSIGGKTIQAVFERFYNDELWRNGKNVGKVLRKLLPKQFKKVCREETVDWSADKSKLTPRELYSSLVPVIKTTLQLIKENRLLGKYARSEVKMQAWFDKVLVHGIADFIIRRDDGIMILDGKLTVHRDKYLKKDQLIWYVMLFYLQHRKMVSKVGWIYYTYGELDWVPVTLVDVKRLHGEVQETIRLIRKNRFDATPSEDACMFCDYKKDCKPGQAMDTETLSRRAVKRQKGYKETGSPLAKDLDGVEEIGF